ncbi:hypothetical protein J4573_07060 [Actinomadura barringtoniae]|uniref:Uncharacterized protein n=1 Tax=Actinomadura barringtoniae TaxID=1427535 RepID=A0A939T8F0_9ACTN|nr:hypothetical protein [Actinomadura barringtoniae]MBO2446845.1 hypothetical protein [Actinomadura barringtoniae]
MRRLVMSVALAIFLVAGLLALGHHYTWWGPEPPNDPNALVLRVRFVKGMASPTDRPVPDISVYGDGRTITTGFDLTTSPAREVVKDQRLTHMAYRRLYRDARLAGLGSSRTFSSHEQIIDGGRTDITLLTEGKARLSKMPAGAGGVRVWLIDRMLKRLRSLPAGDLVRPPVTYHPERLALVSFPASEPDPKTPTAPWPLAPLPVNTGATCTMLNGPDVDKALQLAQTTSPTPYWRSGKTLYTVTFRPLLPDEHDCTAVTP